MRLLYPLVACGALACAASAADLPPYRDPGLPIEARVRDLVSRLTLDEKAGLMKNGSAGVPRLGVPQYDWWNEALHGVARAGVATVYPQAIGLAATWDDGLVRAVADTISTEARAKYNDAVAHGNRKRYYGLTFWTPNINIFRDPRWGRGQETYGEDPYLTSRIGVAFVRGLQGDDPRYLKAAACAKHFAVHSGPEQLRHGFDAEPDPADFHETYLPAFEALVREGRVEAVMTAYNSLYGQPCAINSRLYDLLYRQWGFDGHVVSDCGAIRDLYTSYKVAPDAAGAEALAVRAGLCLRCGEEKSAIADAVRRGLLQESEVDQRLGQLLRTMFRLGFFDPPAQVPYSRIPLSENHSPAHAALALEAARKAAVLLKNDGTLPLRSAALHRVAVIGPNADSVAALVGNYAGTPAAPVTVLAGLRAALGPGVTVDYARGCDWAALSTGSVPNPPTQLVTGNESTSAPDAGFDEALAKARDADSVVFVGGLTAQLEGEEMRIDRDGFHGGDRTRIELPEVQERLLEALAQLGKPIVFVLMSGSAVAVPWADAHVNAILEAWYPGEAGGAAVADVLLGRSSPAGRLPVTFYRATADLPDFTDYGMANRTYRYFGGRPLYPFGYGLSYTRFVYGPLRVQAVPDGGGFEASIPVTNAGGREGDEVVQLYARAPAGSHPRDRESLCGFRRIHLAAGETGTVVIRVSAESLRRWSPAADNFTMPRGAWHFLAGASSADIRQEAVAAN